MANDTATFFRFMSFLLLSYFFRLEQKCKGKHWPRKKAVLYRKSIAIPAFFKESFEKRSRISAYIMSASMVMVTFQITAGKDTVPSKVNRCPSPNLKTHLDSP